MKVKSISMMTTVCTLTFTFTWCPLLAPVDTYILYIQVNGDELTLKAGVFSLDGTEALILTETKVLTETSKPPSPSENDRSVCGSVILYIVHSA